MEKPTGIFFSNQKVQDLVDAVSSFEEISQDITAKDCRENAEKFAISVFRKRFSDFVNDVVLIEKKNNG